MSPYSFEPSEVFGHQVPRISHYPERVHHGVLVPGGSGKITEVGQAAIDLAALAGLHLDPWEQLVLSEMLAERDHWYYNDILETNMRTFAAYEVGLVVSRQNGKGSILEARELAGLFLLGERTILHTAHEAPTAFEGFSRIEALISGTPELRKEVARGGIKWSHGSESITLRSGQRLLFKTRTKGGARGFTVDCLVFDESMYLKKEHIEAMGMAVSARPNAQKIYTGSAGTKESEHMGRVRARGIKGNDPRLAFMEWSVDACTDLCPKDCTEHDRTQITEQELRNLSPEGLERAHVQLVESYRKSNPGLGYRLTVENIESERMSYSHESFKQERLGVGDWPVDGDAWSVIPEEAWFQRVDVVATPQAPLVFAIDVTPDMAYSCIAVGGLTGEVIDDVKRVSVEVTQDAKRYDHRHGRGWVVARMLDLAKEWRPRYVVIDKGSQAGPFIDDLEEPLRELGVEILSPTMREYAQGCGMFYSAIVPRRGNAPYLVHHDQPMLNAAVAGAEKRDLSDLWAWDKRNASADISPLVACTHALWGVHKAETLVQASAPWVMRR